MNQPNWDKEYSHDFDKMRENRVHTSYYKYGSAEINFGEKLVDARGCIDLCLRKFDKTGNTEYLLDAANYCMLRYMYPQGNESFKPTDSGESAGIVGISVKEMEDV